MTDDKDEQKDLSGIFSETRIESEVIWISSPLGPIMITRDGHYLCDDEGNVVSEVDRSYAEQWFNSKGNKPS